MKKSSLILSAFILLTFSLFSQVAINMDGSSADESAMLHVQSTDKGILIPRMNESQRLSIPNPSTGLLVYQNNNTSGFYYNAGSEISPNWIKLASAITNSITDADGDTKIEVEANSDNDQILFTTTGNEAMVINENGNIGIGNTSPSEKLDVTGNLKISGNIIQNAGSNIRTDEIKAESDNGLLLNDDTGKGIQILDGGRVVIGNGSSVAQLTINPDASNTAGLCVSNNNVQTWLPFYDGCNYITGDLTVSGLGHTIFRASDGVSFWNRMIIKGNDGLVGINTLTPSAVLSVNGAADKPGGGSWGSFSDIRSKENIMEYDRGLDELMQLKPVFYNYKAEFEWGNKTYVGLIAQEVEKVIPDMIEEVEIKNIDNFKRVDPSELTYLLINAVQEQQNQIDELKQQNLELSAKLDQLEKTK